MEPNKVTITPQYDTRANQHAPKSLKTEQNPKSQNREYKYPVTTFKRKSSRIHITPNSSPTTSPSDISYSTKASRRKKARKRTKNKSLMKQEASKLLENDDNYPIPEKSINNEDRNKSRKLNLQIKSNVEPRPFSSVARSAEKSQESNLGKLINSEINFNVSDRNIHPNTVKINDDSSKIMDPLKISSSESKRKLYEEDNSTVKSSPLFTSTDSNESFKPNRDNPSYKNVQTTERNDFFDSESVTTQSNSYENIPTTIDSTNPIVSTSTESNLYSPNHMYYYPPLLSTMAPLRQFEVRPTVETESKIDDSNEEDKENTKEDNEEIDKASSDDVTMVTTSENDENRKYEIRKDEDHRTEGRQNHRESPESAEDSSERYKKYEDKGYRRYAHKYNDKVEEEEEEDVVSDGTHDNESHQSAKEGAADDASGKGGEKKFEKGGATEHEQGHHKSEGEKEKKVGDVNSIRSIINRYSIFMFRSINF